MTNSVRRLIDLTHRKTTPLAAGLLAVFFMNHCVSTQADVHPASPPQYDGYELVWHDEFDIDGPPNPDHWVFGAQGFIRNNEDQWYQDDNAVVRDGHLIIEAREERRPNPDFIEGSESWKTNRPYILYTSSLINTRGQHEWLYGRFEVRAKIQNKPGLWPAIWTLGSARGWPGCGEIDIMECYRGNLLANAAWAKADPNNPYASRWDAVKVPVATLPNPENWDDRFHVWRMDWDHDFIRIYVDGHLLNEVDLSKTFNETPDGANPFREPHYLLLNLALGGDNADNPAETDTEFPTQFIVDYARVYQRIQKDGAQ